MHQIHALRGGYRLVYATDILGEGEIVDVRSG